MSSQLSLSRDRILTAACQPYFATDLYSVTFQGFALVFPLASHSQLLAEFLHWASRYRRLAPLQGLMTIRYPGGYAFTRCTWRDGLVCLLSG